MPPCVAQYTLIDVHPLCVLGCFRMLHRCSILLRLVYSRPDGVIWRTLECYTKGGFRLAVEKRAPTVYFVKFYKKKREIEKGYVGDHPGVNSSRVSNPEMCVQGNKGI